MNPKPNLIKGSLFIVIAFFSMAVFGVLTRQATLNGGRLWVSFISYFTCMLFLLPIVLKNGIVNSLRTHHFSYHLGRTIFGLSASFLFTIAINYTSIVDAILLLNTAPIFIPIIAMIWLKNKISRGTWLAVALGFVGIILIINPDKEILTDYGNFIGLASGISLAVAFLFVKLLTPTDDVYKILFYFFFLSSCIQLPLLFFAGPLIDNQSILFAVFAGIAYISQQFFLVKGYQLGDAAKLGVYQYTAVAFVALLDWIFWGKVPSLQDLPGVILIIIAAFVIIRSSKVVVPVEKN